MNTNHLLIWLFMFSFCNLQAQTFLYKDLSKKFDYRLTCELIKSKDSALNTFQNSKITVVVIDKYSKTTIQTIHFIADFLFETAFKDRNAVRSYITNKNKNVVVSDYDYGDLIIADLNFDGKEDIAVKHDSGGNGGPFYNYYIQNEKGTFVKDSYLSEKVNHFPDQIDTNSKTIVTITHANYRQQSETTFKCNAISKKWRLLKSILID